MSDVRDGDPLQAGGGRPLLSIGIFGYNHEDYLELGAQSVLDSTFQSWELFVIDDGSKDGTPEKLRAWEASHNDPRVNVLIDGVNRGLAARLNQVLDLANGEFLALLGGDDVFLPNGLQLLVNGIEDDVDVVWGDLEVMDAHGRSKGYCRPRDTWQGSTARKYVHPGPVGHDILRRNNFVSGTSPIIRVSALRALGGYPTGVLNEDLDLWLRMGRDHKFRYVNAPVAQYRLLPGSTSRSEETALRDQAGIVRRQLEADAYPRNELARLLVMRWLLSVARRRGSPAVSLKELATASGLKRSELISEIPSAGATPLALSAQAYVTRMRRP